MLTLELIPSHKVAQWLLHNIHHLLDLIGLEKDKTTEEVIYVAIIVIASLAIGQLISTGVRLLVKKIVTVRNPRLAAQLVENHVLIHGCRIIPPLVILALLPFAFTGTSKLLNAIIIRSILVYTTIVICMALSAIARFIWMRFDEIHNSRNLPVKGILDTIIGILWVVCIIVSIAIICDKSPVSLLTGLGAFAAVLMLVFKDSILGLVAGLQLSQNDMLHVGDWITVPSTKADGIVVDVSLTAVKVQNFDNTIVTLPPYTLVSSSFQNWRGMTEMGHRQIARTIKFEMYSIKSVDAGWIDSMTAQYPVLKPYVDSVRAQGSGEGYHHFTPGTTVVNGTLDTNMGLFRAYLCAWLLDNPNITKDQQILVRLMAPDEYGIPLQIWCYTSTPNWTVYEATQSAIFEHIIVTAPLFGLNIFNDTSAMDSLTVNLNQAKSAEA